MSSVMSPRVGTTAADDGAGAAAAAARTTPVNSSAAAASTRRDESTQKDAVDKAAQEIKKAAEKAADEVPALDRLAASRMRLRSAMMEIAHPAPQPPLMGGRIGDLGNRLLDRLRQLPGASFFVETVERLVAGASAAHRDPGRRGRLASRRPADRGPQSARA